MRLRLYLDTSVISAHVDDRLPERRRATLEFSERLAGYEVAISELTLTEVRATADSALREQPLALVGDFLSLRSSEKPAISHTSMWGAVCFLQRRRSTPSTWRLRSPRGRISS